MSESDNTGLPEDFSDLENAMEALETDSVEFETLPPIVEEEVCIPCSKSKGKQECTYCNENNEWPLGYKCKMCKGTGYRK